MQTSSQCTVCQSFIIKFYQIFNIRKYINTLLFSLFCDGRLHTSELVTYWTGVMFYEKRMTPLGRLSHKQHDETRPAEATMIQTKSESKCIDFILSFPFSLPVQISFL